MLDLSGLNPPQREAVVHGDGPLLVLAGAGSGKTRVLTMRVAHLLERGWPARAICALSFTNRAADEMRERLDHLVGPRESNAITMSTFHSLGLMILKAEKEAFGFPKGFVIYDTADQMGAIREILRSVKVDDRRWDVKAILHRISRAKNAFVGPDEYQVKDEYDEITKLVFPKYQKALKSFAAVDFDDLIVECVHLLDRDEKVGEKWGTRYRYVLVDEYQDTNKVQLELVRRLCKDHANVTVVGDDDQSIYAWRGAEASNILGFDRHFPGAQIVKLEQNYRSTPTILAAANAVIKNNVERHAKQLWSDKDQGQKIVTTSTLDADGEAKFVCDEIERLRLEEKIRYGDIAILYRSNIQSRPLEEAVRTRRIPYVMVGGTQFYERKEIKDVIAYLKIAINPNDEISLRRIINYPARGIGQATIEKVAQWSHAREIPMWEGLLAIDDIPGVNGPTREVIHAFVAQIEKTRGLIMSGPGSAATQTLVDDINLVGDLRDASTSASQASRRIDHVRELVKSIGERDAGGPDALANYLNLLSLRPQDDDDSEDEGDVVTLTTLHGSKGLEWPVVFLVGVEEELLPHARTLYPQGPDCEGEADVSEERRLAYVGITRARERLYITRALMRHKHGRDRPQTPSRFLLEIPPELLQVRDLLAEARQPVKKEDLKGFFSNFLK